MIYILTWEDEKTSELFESKYSNLVRAIEAMDNLYLHNKLGDFTSEGFKIADNKEYSRNINIKLIGDNGLEYRHRGQ